MNWLPYQSCCQQAATDPEAAFCPHCRHPLLRCHGFAACGQLLGPQQPCPLHVAPELSLRQDGLQAPQVGDRMNLPLVLANPLPGAAALRVVGLWLLPRDGQPRPLELQWESLPSGQQRALSVDTEPLDSGGTVGVRLVTVVGARFASIDEDYAFVGEIGLTVGREQQGQVIQNIHIEGSHIAAGGSAVLQTGPSVSESFRPRELSGDGRQTVAVPLERAERFERQRGIRGYALSGTQIARTVELVCEGFAAADAPASARPFLLQPVIGLGRSAPGHRGDAGAESNFACLRAYDAGGRLLQEPSLAVSRRHFELILRCGRLYLRTLGHGGRLDDGELSRGETTVLKDGDVFNPTAEGDPQLDFRVDFECDQGDVQRIRLRRG
jgi:hypothetical protein